MTCVVHAWRVGALTSRPSLGVHTHHARGATTLALMMATLLAVTLALAHTHRHAVQDARLARQSIASMHAKALAESGLAWLQSRLNDRGATDADEVQACAVDASSTVGHVTSLRSMLLHAPTPSSGADAFDALRPRVGRQLVCEASDDALPVVLACRCVDGPSRHALASPSVVVLSIHAMADDATQAQLRAMACVGGAQGCGLPTRHDADDATGATAHAAVLVKRLTRLVHLPGSAWMTGDPSLIGALSLRPLRAHDATWLPRFTGLARHALTSSDCNVLGADAAARGAAVAALARRTHRPCQVFWLDDDVTLRDVGALGVTEPILIATAGRLRLEGNTQVRGLAYQDGDADMVDHPQSAWRGAWVVAGSAHALAALPPGRLVHDPLVLRQLAADGDLVRVPGSWFDQR